MASPTWTNLNTHSGASLYKAFPLHVARSLLDKLACVYTPKHGGWLNLAECEFSVLGRQCLDRRLPDFATIASEVPGMDGDPELIQSTRRLALYHGRRTDQAQMPLSYIMQVDVLLVCKLGEPLIDRRAVYITQRSDFGGR